ncbi:MAG: WD40 repeat domain-containing protein [Treponema sp.]|jgi:hypothetical protein|nr:WD40 repeat domain-containing protein [Treponema sp.]
MERMVSKAKRKHRILICLAFFTVYIFAAARPIPQETVLVPRWLSSLESGYPAGFSGDAGQEAAESPASAGGLIPFRLGKRFGYVDQEGRFSINQPVAGKLSLSRDYWAEYEADPESIEIRNPEGGSVLKLENTRGDPLFLDNRIFLVGDEQNTLSALDEKGEILWSYDFAAPLTCIDAAAGMILTGSLDGAVEVLDASGRRVFLDRPAGSRISVILGCSFSRDGNMIGIISGIDDQRFLLLERFGTGEYKVTYHEFLENGFRRPVHVSFIDQDNRIVFERESGLGIYELNTRISRKLSLKGEVAALDGAGNDGFLFVISSQGGQEKRLVGIELPGSVIMEAPFKSSGFFLERRGALLYLGGGSALASFKLEKR